MLGIARRTVHVDTGDVTRLRLLRVEGIQGKAMLFEEAYTRLNIFDIFRRYAIHRAFRCCLSSRLCV